MFERKIEETIALLKRETIGDQDTYSIRQIVASTMPVGLRVFFERDIDVWVIEEKSRLLESPHFSFSDDGLLSIFDDLIQALPGYARFTAVEYDQALERNVKLLFNYICRPQWSLSRYYFTDREHVATDEIVVGLRHFWHYEYYRIILTEYFNKKGVSVINARTFQDLVSNIDHEVVRGFDSKKLATLTEPIFDLFNIGIDSDGRSVPLEALSIFFDDKNMVSIVERLDREKQSREFIGMHDLIVLIGDVDYSMSLDISSIVTKHAKSLGVIQPEIFEHAGKDFEVPSFNTTDEESVDVGDEERQLDFVITNEEMGVVEQDFDRIIPHQLEADGVLVDEETYDALAMDDSEDEYTAEILPNTEPSSISSIDEPESDIDEEHTKNYAAGFTDQGILAIEDGLELEDEPDELDDAESMDYEPDDFDEISTLPAAMVDPDEIDDIGLLDDAELPSTRQTDITDDFELNISLDDDDDDLLGTMHVPSQNPAELDIDWAKEAANISDIKIEEDQRPSPAPENAKSNEVPAEKKTSSENSLLPELDLDDFEEMTLSGSKVKSNPLFDLPLIDEGPSRERSVSRQDTAEYEETPIAAEEVIRQFGDLTQLIPSSDQKKYAKRLFNRNDDVVRHALAVLNGKASWREASEYIDELFIKHDVDLYSKIAVQFTDDVYKRYLPRK